MCLFLPRTYCGEVALTMIWCFCESVRIVKRVAERARVCYSRRVMRLPAWNASQRHEHCNTEYVADSHCFPVTLNSTEQLKPAGWFDRVLFEKISFKKKNLFFFSHANKKEQKINTFVTWNEREVFRFKFLWVKAELLRCFFFTQCCIERIKCSLFNKNHWSKVVFLLTIPQINLQVLSFFVTHIRIVQNPTTNLTPVNQSRRPVTLECKTSNVYCSMVTLQAFHWIVIVTMGLPKILILQKSF